MYFRKIAAMSYLYKVSTLAHFAARSRQIRCLSQPNEPADSIYIVLAGEVDVEEDLVSMNSNISKPVPHCFLHSLCLIVSFPFRISHVWTWRLLWALGRDKTAYF